MVRNFKQEDGTYLYPMELAGKQCEEDRAARAADIAQAKHCLLYTSDAADD